MPLSHGRPYLAIPGPSVIPDRVLQAMHRPAPNIYEGALVEMVEGMMPDLKAAARTAHDVAMYIANGHGAWEAAISNTCSRGDKVLVLATGRFGPGWGEVARRMGVEVEVMDFGKRAPVDAARVAERLSADSGHEIHAVLVVHVDTATAVRNDIPAIRAAIDAAGHPALFMVDCIASLACDAYDMDGWGVDVTVAGCQKGLMTPPGMSFVYFNGKAAEARQKADLVSQYWDWAPRADPQVFYQYFGGTAPTHHLYGLRTALDMLMHEEGLDAALARHRRLARTVWAALEAWGADGPMEINIADPAHRSHAVTAVRIGPPHGTALRDWLAQTAGVTLGIGLGMAEPGDPAWHGFFRIGHMGHVNAHMILGALGAIEAGLVALDIPHGKGALEAAAGVVAAG
ncbi:alanine-glyoxylate transaminase/serine-glyoxylate transaminase/serine-pyruvate transaminase [Rhodovulum iodosum]|uniref:Alanine-glyoxylate transaminase/serine-glyoxylate transaminase/serine-pyruvate transaminase n=1 Tax=Rhodovulum iodosum TaxID=68291 RepID=A0ABV3XP46_9RHOB|nr:aminotransferase class V-fold PLP-dependent enzyme [Rhodovulum robiginosum]RSK31596.1 alanine--glyoxylate aminotransferase family protein [Rhodovulum robiginosum]